jgi:hypothetical protein
MLGKVGKVGTLGPEGLGEMVVGRVVGAPVGGGWLGAVAGVLDGVSGVAVVVV